MKIVILWGQPMHIPDGFLSTGVCVAAGAASAAAVTLTARRAQGDSDEGRAPLLGVMGAFVFAAQMINFPVGPGTTGHLLGGALLAITLGPAAALVVMTAILAIQALVFQDGGVLALGANVFNMAVAGVFAAYLPYRLLAAGRARSAGIFLAGALSVITSAALALGELTISGVAVPPAVLGLSAGLFAVNAALEGLITLGVVQALERLNRGWIWMPGRLRPATVIVGFSALFLAAVGVLAASSAPDGLEKLAERLGIAAREFALVPTPLADYQIGFLSNPWLRRSAAGVAGLMLVYGTVILLGRTRARRKGA